jgi:tellurite resistance protein TerC
VDPAFAYSALVVVIAALVAEQRLFARDREARRGEAVAWALGWIAVATVAAAVIAWTGGPAGAWTTVYLIERSLSLDNVFLFSLLLASFAVPPELRGRVITIGVAGALLLRGVAIVAGLAVIDAVQPVVYVFGALLLYVAYRAFRGAPEGTDPAGGRLVSSVRRALPTTDTFRGARLVARDDGRLLATPLLLAAVAVVLADIAFAVDSIPAALVVTRDPLVIWTANAFALLGLGSLLALVDWLVQRFRYLGRTIAVVLAFVGVRILTGDLLHVSDAVSLGVIAAVLAAGVAASLAADRRWPPHPVDEARRSPPRCPPELARAPGVRADRRRS